MKKKNKTTCSKCKLTFTISSKSNTFSCSFSYFSLASDNFVCSSLNGAKVCKSNYREEKKSQATGDSEIYHINYQTYMKKYILN